MASELQRRKVTGVFVAMDVDGDGFLEEADFRALARRWTVQRGSALGSPAADRLNTIMMGWWTTLLAASDLDRDNRVSLDEVLGVVDRLGEMLDAVTGTAEAMFEAVDENGDGEISAAEYRGLIEAWSGRATDTDAVFARLDGNGDGRLSKPEFVELWTEFWAGDDPDAPGTVTFGEL
ncbi:MAG: calcium sensor EFh [Mycobacteriaceae bacterium]|nr:calcium sensor EFh [Mycobacteriaceae bacterium]